MKSLLHKITGADSRQRRRQQEMAELEIERQRQQQLAEAAVPVLLDEAAQRLQDKARAKAEADAKAAEAKVIVDALLERLNCAADEPPIVPENEWMVDCFSFVDTAATGQLNSQLCVHPINHGQWMPLKKAHHHAARAYADIRRAGRQCARVERRGPAAADSAWTGENPRDRREWFREQHLWGGDPDPALRFQLELWTVGQTHHSLIVRRRDTPTSRPEVVGQVDFVFIK